MIDDATRLLARFVPHDSTEENMKLPETCLQRFGPIASVLHRQGEPVPESREDQAGRIAAGTRRQGNAFDAERPGRRGLKAAASSLAARNQKMCKQPLADSFGKAVPQSRGTRNCDVVFARFAIHFCVLSCVAATKTSRSLCCRQP
jgi:hypothetical protein